MQDHIVKYRNTPQNGTKKPPHLRDLEKKWMFMSYYYYVISANLATNI